MQAAGPAQTGYGTDGANAWMICVANVGSQLTGPITRRTFAEQGVLVISTMVVKPDTALCCYMRPQAEKDKIHFHSQQGKIDRW